MDELTGIALGHVSRLGRQAVNYAQEIDRANNEIDKANRIIAEKNRRIAELELALWVKTAHGEGMKAYRDAFKAAHPTSPVLSSSGFKYKDGMMKPKGALAYDAAFDRILRDARISNPEQYRD